MSIAAELPKNLPARATRRSQEIGIGNYRNALQFPGSFGDRLHNGDAFGADGQAIGCVFDVAAREDAAVFVFNGRPYLKFRKWGVRTLPYLYCRFDQRVHNHELVRTNIVALEPAALDETHA